MINLINTLILGIELPSTVVTAINRKIEQYYISEEYKFRVAREVRELERKKVEAEGIHEFQQIVGQGISDSYAASRRRFSLRTVAEGAPATARTHNRPNDSGQASRLTARI